jgi:rfaE bifunctional protein nucleotidyltransferase chain/domain
MKKKIRTKEELEDIVINLKKQHKKIVTTNGAFDLFHYGHLKSLKFAKGKGDILIVCINSDASVKKNKSEKRPIVHEKERSEIVAAIELVDYVTIFDEETPVEVLETIKPDIHVKGSEFDKKVIEKTVVEKNNGKVVLMKRDKDDFSTSKIIRKIVELYG